jgi:hypothetical protein
MCKEVIIAENGTVADSALKEIEEHKVFAINIGFRESGGSCVILAKNYRNAVTSYELVGFGKTVFLTRKEAEAKLAETGEKEC